MIFFCAGYKVKFDIIVMVLTIISIIIFILIYSDCFSRLQADLTSPL